MDSKALDKTNMQRFLIGIEMAVIFIFIGNVNLLFKLILLFAMVINGGLLVIIARKQHKLTGNASKFYILHQIVEFLFPILLGIYGIISPIF